MMPLCRSMDCGKAAACSKIMIWSFVGSCPKRGKVVADVPGNILVRSVDGGAAVATPILAELIAVVAKQYSIYLVRGFDDIDVLI